MTKTPFQKIIESEIGSVIEEDTDMISLDDIDSKSSENEDSQNIDIIKELTSLAENISTGAKSIEKAKDTLSKWKSSDNTELHLASEKIIHEIEDIIEFLNLSVLELKKTAKDAEKLQPA